MRTGFLLFTTSSLMFPPHGGQDRLAIQQFDDRIVLVVADGAGGTRGGAEAAQFACDRVMQFATVSAGSSRDWTERLHAIDRELSKSDLGGQTTLVVAEVWNGAVSGAAVGDSQAWLVSPRGEMLDLTEDQQRKPLLGAGTARPCPFGPIEMRGGRLLLATDGLFRYAAQDKVLDVAAARVIPRAPSLLIDLARLPNGELQDDVAVVICEEGVDRIDAMQGVTALLPQAQEGDPDACLVLAELYESLDQQEAATHWFKMAADAGSTQACYGAGLGFAKGLGVTQDYAAANHYYQLGAQRGCAMAISNLGYHYEFGDRGLDQNLERALDCYKRAAELGADVAQSNLAQAYQHGKFGLTPRLGPCCGAVSSCRSTGKYGCHGVVGKLPGEGSSEWPSIYAKAIAQFRRAMAKGNAKAVWRYGLMFELGRGVDKDNRQAVRWYTEAAQHGCIEAQRCLGNMYRWGRGVTADTRLANYWLGLAARGGDEEAKSILAGLVLQSDECGQAHHTTLKGAVHDGTTTDTGTIDGTRARR